MPAIRISVPDDIDFTRPARVPAAVLSAPIRRVEAPQPDRPRTPLDPAKLNRSIRAAAERHRRRLTEEAKEDRAEADQIKRARELEKQGVEVSGSDAGTPTTRHNVTRDAMLVMLEDDRIDQPQYDAGVLIAKGFQLTTMGMDARIATYGHRVPGAGDAAEYAMVIVGQYATWAKAFVQQEQAAGRNVRGCRPSRWDAVLDVIVWGMSCDAVERRRRMGKGRLFPVVLEALDLFNDIRWRRGKWRDQKAGANYGRC